MKQCFVSCFVFETAQARANKTVVSMRGGLDASEYKAAKEAFFHDLHGTTHWEVFVLSQCMPLLLCLGESSGLDVCMHASSGGMLSHGLVGASRHPDHSLLPQGKPSHCAYSRCAAARQPEYRLQVPICRTSARISCTQAIP